MENLMILTKILSDNFRVLHRNLVGPSWFGDHEILEGYYKKMDDIQDDVIEIGISMGIPEPTFASIMEMGKLPYPGLPSGVKFNNDKAFQYTYNFFNALIEAFEAVKKQVPGDVYSKFEEYIYWLRKEAEYKIKHRLGK